MLALSTYGPSSIVIRNCLGGRLKGGVQTRLHRESVAAVCGHTPNCLYCCFSQVCCSSGDWVILIHIFIFLMAVFYF